MIHIHCSKIRDIFNMVPSTTSVISALQYKKTLTSYQIAPAHREEQISVSVFTINQTKLKQLNYHYLIFMVSFLYKNIHKVAHQFEAKSTQKSLTKKISFHQKLLNTN